jgi:hypothetical protein
MDENTVVGKLATGGDPQMLSREIIRALAESEKFGYDVVFEETIEPDDRLTITVSCSGKYQVLVIPGWVWRDRGRVRQTVIDQLTI